MRKLLPGQLSRWRYLTLRRRVCIELFAMNFIGYFSTIARHFRRRLTTPKHVWPLILPKPLNQFFRLALHDELRKQRKVALRLGHLLDQTEWRLRAGRLKQLLDGSLDFNNLADADFEFATLQKGVDMRIGLDIASLSFKRQVDQIILVAGDSDFVPAAKLARREGIDFILDPLWSVIHASLQEHVDGVRSTCPNPANMRNPTS
jgi:uncharacterized LabA/DUF88 family protein